MRNQRIRFLALSIIRAITNRPTRVLLLAASLAITASLATALVAVSQGVEARLARSLKAYGANLIVESSAKQVGAGGLSLGELNPGLDPADYTASIRAVQGVESVKPRVRITVRTSGEEEVQLIGMSLDEMATSPWKRLGAVPRSGQVLVGAGLAARLGLSSGSVLPGFEGVSVSGVVETGSEQDDAIFMPLDGALKLTGGKVTEFLVRADGSRLEQVSVAIEGVDSALSVRTLRQVAEAESSLLDKVRRLLLIVTLSVALVSAIAVGSTQSIVVLERTQEIGLLKAMGSTRRFIVGYFALEGGAIALSGGAFGLIAGIVVAQIIAAGVFGAAIPVAAVVWPVPFVVAGVVSFLAGAIPVWRASAIDPAMTLKGL